MKLVTHFLLIICIGVPIKCHRMQEQFPFPPKFQTPSSGIMVSDSSIYLPPEPHTPIPYFAVNAMNKLPYQFLPPSVTNAPSVYPMSNSIIFSSTIRPNFDDDNSENNRQTQLRIPSPKSAHIESQGKKNVTDQMQERRDIRILPKMFSFEQLPLKRMDEKQSASLSATTLEPLNQSSASRRMILTSELQRNEAGEHSKSYSKSQFSQLPNLYFSSTTEPAIPILRLSNEMDLDGSFSYEALGADQTHYVQHSRMENLGSAGEEQVVEGSYSYVGDNGQTYTVHYVADSNGYRASGDHLPSPPPIPEIIQRSIQYNLAEEARRPPYVRSSWEEGDSDREINVEDKSSQIALTTSRGLFTGKTPEAFSFGFGQNSNSQNNQLLTSAISLVPKTSFDIAVDLSKSKQNSGSISPQITFAASQGTRNPSSTSQQLESRTSIDKPSLPQIMSYQASSREMDQESKPLWRWQYGMNANGVEQSPNKNTISRSSADGDDIIINFNDMTPRQYTDMIKSQILEQNEDGFFSNNLKAASTQSTPDPVIDTSSYVSNTMKNYNEENQLNLYSTSKNNIYSYANNNQVYSKNINDIKPQKYFSNEYSTLRSDTFLPTSTDRINTQKPNFNYFNEYTKELKIQPQQSTRNAYPELIRQENYLPPNQVVTKSYDYEEFEYEPEKVNKSFESRFKNDEIHNANHQKKNIPSSRYWHSSGEIPSHFTYTTPSYQHSTFSSLQSTNTIQTVEENNFKPITFKTINQPTTTTEKSLEELLRDNIFLKNIVRGKKGESIENQRADLNHTHKVDFKEEKSILKTEVINENPKHIQSLIKPQKDSKTLQKKLDITDVLNYIAMKNNFELSKTKPKSLGSNYQNKPPVNYIPIKEDNRDRDENIDHDRNIHRPFNQQQEELQGMIKNYKVLQRPKNSGQNLNPYSDTQQRHVKIFHSDNLPPLGRAGPSMKSYLPPAYL